MVAKKMSFNLAQKNYTPSLTTFTQDKAYVYS